MTDYRGYVTAAGQAFEALAKQMSYPVTIGFIEVGDGSLPDSESPIARTKLVNPLKSFPAIVEQDLKSPGQWVASINIPADDEINGAGYFIREIGCKLVNQGSGILYAYRRVSDDWKPVITSGEAKSFIYKLRFIPSNGELLTPTIDPSVVLVNKEELDRTLKEHEASCNHPEATTTGKGFVQLNDSISSTSTTQAATANAVRRTYDEATRSASTSHAGRVQLNDSISSTSTTQAATANAVRRTYDEATRSASISHAGRVQLNDSISSTSTTQAATANAVRRTYDEATRSASISHAGRVQLNDSISSTSTTQAATANAVRRTYDEATRSASISHAGRVQLNDSISSTSTTQAATANAVRRTYDEATRSASISHAGRVQLNDSISSTSTTQAATANAVRRTYDEATRSASISHAGRVQLNDSVSSTSTTQAATAYAVKRTYDEATRAASTNQAGRVRLNDSISSTSTTQAATPNAVKLAYDRASEALPVGTPCPWPSLNIPSGWIKCAGQSFSTSSYPDLARAYPNGRLPDLRGEFIRGYDDGRGVDSGRSILTEQGDAIRNITGTVTGISETFSYSGSGSGVFQRTSSGPGAEGTPSSVDWSNAGTLDFDVSRVAPTANENRPRNIAFLYIVRAA